MGEVRFSASGDYGTKTVGTSAGLLVGAAATRSSLLIQNKSSNEVYIGFDSSVTASNGFHLTADDSVRLSDYIGDVYAIASAASSDVRYLEVK